MRYLLLLFIFPSEIGAADLTLTHGEPCTGKIELYESGGYVKCILDLPMLNVRIGGKNRVLQVVR